MDDEGSGDAFGSGDVSGSGEEPGSEDLSGSGDISGDGSGDLGIPHTTVKSGLTGFCWYRDI